jgi:hypothetical protein
MGCGVVVEDFTAAASVAHLPEMSSAVELAWWNCWGGPPGRGVAVAEAWLAAL